jgi:hypothetical protein
VSGYALGERRQHTFQISSRIHLYDRWFCGLLRHSCSPNVYFDIHYLEVWTLEAITAGSWLTLDFATPTTSCPVNLPATAARPNAGAGSKAARNR